jgi:hypothetical protein
VPFGANPLTPLHLSSVSISLADCKAEVDESDQKGVAVLSPLTVNFILEDLDQAVKFRQEGKGLLHKSFRELAVDYPSHDIFFKIADNLSKMEHGSDLDYFLLKSI